MDKSKLVELIQFQLEKEIAAAKAAALETYQAATGEESQPENEYDTRALEASYLAGAQAKRVLELEKAAIVYKYLQLRSFNDESEIGPTALVEMDLNGKNLLAFIVPDGGGLIVDFNGRSVQILTPKSPLGEVLIGLKTGDVAVVEKGDQSLEYEILSVH